MSERGTPVNYNYNASEQRGKGKAIEEMARTDALQKRTQKDEMHSNVLSEIAKFYKEIEKHPRRSKYETMLPSRKDLKAIRSASPQQLAAYSEALSKNRAEYDQEVKRIAPAATPSAPTAPAPTAPAPATPAPAAAAPPATAKPKQISGLMDAIKADSPVNKLMTPPSFPTAGAPQAAQPFAPTAPQVGPTAAQSPAAPPPAAPAPPTTQNSRAMTTPPAGAATVPSFKAQLDANLAAMHNSAPAASTYKQLQPQDEVAAMEEQMIGGGYQIPKGGLKKDGAGYHVIDEKGRKLMVAPTAAMRFNVQERMNGMGGLSNTLKPGQTMTDRASAYLGRAPQPVANTTVRDAQARLDQMHVADQQAVMKAYPLIGNKGGAMNKLFTDAYNAAPKGTDMMKLANSMFAQGGTHFAAYSSMPKTPFAQPAPVGPTVPAEQQSPLDAIKAQSPAEKMMKPPTSPMMEAAYANRPPPPQPLGSAETGQVSAYTMNGLTTPPTAPASKIEDGIPSTNLQQGPMGMETPETRLGSAYRGIDAINKKGLGNTPLEGVLNGVPRPVQSPQTEGGGMELNDFYSQPQDYNGVVMQTTDQQQTPKAQSADPNFIAKEILGKPVDDPYAGFTEREIIKSNWDLYQQKGAEEEAARVKQFKANEEKFNQYEGAPARAKAREYDPSKQVF